VPIAGYCVETETGLMLWGLVGDAATGHLVRAEASGPRDAPEALGRAVAEMLRERGAQRILAAHV
jgi:hydroxymethylbilane synthase